jgi:hypothetical protein
MKSVAGYRHGVVEVPDTLWIHDVEQVERGVTRRGLVSGP